jgi:hypothetical protein
MSSMSTFHHMTTDQRNIVRVRERIAFERLEEAYKNAAEAHNAIVPLPHKNEDGLPVIASCNTTMIDIRDAWRVIARVWEIRCEWMDLERTRELCDKYGGDKVCGGRRY